MSIPVRNIWWLMLYASDLGKAAAPALLAAEDLPEEIPDLVAEILARAVEQRQRRQLSTAFRHREAVLSRVRGRIDHLATARRQLLAQGRIACRFEELTVDNPRNRFVRAALDSVAHGLHRQGVMGEAPSRRQINPDRFNLHNQADQADQAMLAAARLAIDLALPTEEATSGIAQVFPSMGTDIVIDRRNQTLRAGTIYQLYALGQEGVIDRLVAVEAKEGVAEDLKQQLMGAEATEADHSSPAPPSPGFHCP